jgi:cellulose biosynthesis protein BcsQ
LRGASQEDLEAEAEVEPPRGLIAATPNETAVDEGALPHVPAAKRLEASPKPKAEQPAHSADQSWDLLQSLLNLQTVHSGGNSPGERPSAAELPSTTLFGARGGVGTSTIITALGRISAKAAQRVLLVDSATPSFLPLYFGAQSPRSYISTFQSTDHLRERPLHIACGKRDESVRALASEIDCSYVDGGLFRTRVASSSEGDSQTAVLVLMPDARCLAELNWLKHRETNFPFILLNQFDSRRPLHREVQSLLSQQFQDRLIPLTIGYDADVSVALAHGTTIIDYAPASSVTEDLYKLNQWLVSKSRNTPSLELTAAGQGI